MLDAKARIGDRPLVRRHGGKGLLVLVERDAVAAIADGVRLDLDAAREPGHRDAQDLLRRIDEQARIVRGIAVGLIKESSRRTEAAVCKSFQTANS